eukprot:9224196-Pyramimonas_sp.AAC.1
MASSRPCSQAIASCSSRDGLGPMPHPPGKNGTVASRSGASAPPAACASGSGATAWRSCLKIPEERIERDFAAVGRRDREVVGVSPLPPRNGLLLRYMIVAGFPSFALPRTSRLGLPLRIAAVCGACSVPSPLRACRC